MTADVCSRPDTWRRAEEYSITVQEVILVRLAFSSFWLPLVYLKDYSWFSVPVVPLPNELSSTANGLQLPVAVSFLNTTNLQFSTSPTDINGSATRNWAIVVRSNNY